MGVYLFLVETANRTILEIDEKFATHQIKLRRWKNAAPEDKEPLKYSSILARSDKVSDLAVSKTASSNEAQPVDDEECVKTVESNFQYICCRFFHRNLCRLYCALSINIFK